MKTLIVWTDFEGLPELFLVDGDYRHLNNVIINAGRNISLEKELDVLMCSEEGIPKLTAIVGWPMHIASIVDAVFVIRCGLDL